MQGLCHLSRRWHQQFCRSPSFSGHQKCLRRWYHPSPAFLARQRKVVRPPRPTQPPLREATAIRRGDMVVREYEQDDENDPTTRRPIDHNDDPMVQEAQYMKAKMQELEEQMRRLQQGPFGPDSDLMKDVPKHERAELLKELEEQGLNLDSPDNLDMMDEHFMGKDSNEDTKPASEEQDLAVTMRVADKHKAYVANFNTALREAKSKSDGPQAHMTLWKWYLRCQQKIPAFSSFVNEDVWQYLWQSQIMIYAESKHIILLAKDMAGADVDLTHAQRLDYIDALHATGDTASAIQQWERSKAKVVEQTGESDEYKAVAILNHGLTDRFWATGVALYSAIGRPARAQTIALRSLEERSSTSATTQSLMILVDVIQAWAHSQRSDAEIKLWSCYMLMRDEPAVLSNSKSLPTEVLGQITSVLLNTGHRQMALAVFQDMLAAHTGNQSVSNVDLEHRLTSSLSITNDSTANENIINQVGLTSLLALPRKFKNKFFFGAWIKWLLGQDKVDDAALVVELMQEIGVKTDARHLNGIVGAWLRHGSRAARARAEQMAWAMIHARIDLVRSRSESMDIVAPPSQEMEPYTDRQQLPAFLQRNIPPATMETFSVLLLSYTHQFDTDKATLLTDTLTGPAQLKPNSFILNHWLELSLRSSDLSGLINRYESTRSDIAPDHETFSLLWNGCRLNLDRRSSMYCPSYPSPGRLFHDMRTWYLSLPAAQQDAIREDFEDELYEQIIQCFCLHTDLNGAYIALEQLQELFDKLPNAEISTLILMNVARMLPNEHKLASQPRKSAIRRGDALYRQALSVMTNVFEGIMDDMGADYVDKGATAKEKEKINDDLVQEGSHAQRELRLDTLKTFLILVLLRLKRPKVEQRTKEQREGGVLPAEGYVLEELVVAAKGMGADLDQDEVRRRIQDAKEYEET